MGKRLNVNFNFTVRLDWRIERERESMGRKFSMDFIYDSGFHIDVYIDHCVFSFNRVLIIHISCERQIYISTNNPRIFDQCLNAL